MLKNKLGLGMKPSVGVVIVTLNAEKHLPYCLPPLLESPLRPKILIVDSSSTDRTVPMAREMGVKVLVIPRNEFNHGLTREKGRKHINTDIVVMMTQDAYGVDNTLIERLIHPIITSTASVAYARQIPHRGADIFEAFPRHFNYPLGSQVRSLSDVKRQGVYTFFCSDSCAAYKNSALDEIGGFKRVLFGEDTLAVAELLHAGHSIAYVPEAVVHHSHRYSLVQEFRRNFDIGISRKQLTPYLKCAGSDERRGILFLRELTKELARQKPLYLPYAYLQTACKWLGYRLGRACVNAPLPVKRKFSSQPAFWKN